MDMLIYTCIYISIYILPSSFVFIAYLFSIFNNIMRLKVHVCPTPVYFS